MITDDELTYLLSVEIYTLIGIIAYSYIWSVIGNNCSKVVLLLMIFFFSLFISILFSKIRSIKFGR